VGLQEFADSHPHQLSGGMAQRAGFSVLLVTHDVEEALFLAHRVLVFSQRPARIVAEIDVDLPYPRQRGHARLSELRHEALRHLGLDQTW
jgi:NitT/TauT family transport system ATP-binding protein